MKNRFRFKLTASFAATAIVPLLVMGVVAVATIYQTRMRNVLELQNQSLLHINERINKFILEKAENSKFIVKDVKDAADFDDDQLKFTLEGFNSEIRDLIEMSILNKNGDEVGKILNYQGKTDYYGKNSDQLFSQKKLPTYQKTIVSNESIYFSPVEQTMAGPILTIATPIISQITEGATAVKTEKAIGVIVVKVKAAFLTNYLEQLKIGKEGYFLFINNDGYFIASGKKWNSVLPFFKISDQAEKIKTSLSTSALFYEQRDFNNQQVIIGQMPVSSDDVKSNIKDLGWKIIAVWPKDDALALIRVVSWEIIVTILSSLVIIFILSSLLSQQVVKPLELLGEKAALIGAGKLEQKIDIKTNDEFEQLGENFNQMAKGLQEIQKLKDEFVFIAAHELRTPVTVIKGYLSMTFDGDFGKISSELGPVLKKVNGANEQLVQLVNDLLAIAKAEAGGIKIEIAKVDLAQITQKVVDSLRPWAESSNIKLIYKKPTIEIAALADENKLVEVLNNFGSNGIKYNRPNGTVEIWHEVKVDEVITYIKDTGIGLTQEELAHLFEKFYRAENAETRKVHGTGLGLFIVKQLIEKMGGKVEVVSERGKGSTFSFRLKKG